ncbi:hypothetical protein Tco_0643017 [Tanacetum coccineum]
MSTIKLHILMKGEYDVWAMKIEHYLAQLVAHQKGQLWYEEKIRFMKIDLDDKTDVLTYHKKLLAEAEKEKEDLKAKVEKWHNSSKNLGKLLNTQMSANDKFGLGYGDHRYDSILSYENEVLQSVFMNKESDLEIHSLYDRSCYMQKAVPINAARKVNTVKPIVTNVRPKAGFHKSVSPFRKSFNKTTTLRTDKIKRSDDSFIAIGSAEDEKVIKEMNEQVADASKKRVKKDDNIKGEIKEEEGTRKRKLGIRKKMKSKKRKFTSKDDEELRLCLTIVSDEDKEVDYEILDKKYPIIEWRSEYLTTKPQYDETEEIEDVYLNVVIRSNRQRRYFSTLMAVLSILDRDDICAIYQLVMNRYQDETPEGFDKILWGDLIIMFNQSGNDEFWNAQQNWKIVSWKLHSSSGIHTIMTDEGIVIHMLVENKYPLKKEVLSQLLKLKLETEEDSTMALELIRFVKKQIAELEPEDSDGDEKDL